MIATLALIWAACAVAGYFYAVQYEIPRAVYIAVLPAFLIEASLYTVVGVEKWRARVDRLPALPVWLLIAALAPYAVASLALGSFDWRAFGVIGGLATVAAFWFAWLPRRPLFDILFLVFVAAVILARVFDRWYVDPHPKVPLEILGQLMWIRTGAFALLSVRGVEGVGFGFVPTRKDWRIGVVHYLMLLPVCGALAWWIGFAKFRAPDLVWWKVSLVAAATFAGMLWVVALGEEFFFRGLLQQWLGKWLSSDWAGLIIASLLFGGVHLPFRAFPNWRFAIVAAVAGVFYGLAFRRARSIRASMVTHALAATTSRLFFG